MSDHKNHKEKLMSKYDAALELTKTLEDLEDLIRPISTEAAEVIRRKRAGLARHYKELLNVDVVDNQED
jgi:hypothetical protein